MVGIRNALDSMIDKPNTEKCKECQIISNPIRCRACIHNDKSHGALDLFRSKGYECIYECPKCGFDFDRIDAFDVEINFCPSCGEKIKES